MTGEKEPVVVIGKSANPRCFKKVPASSLPVHYYHNKKAWMTGSIFEDWLKKFDRKMKRQRRRVLLFLDNAPSHPKLTLKNVTLQFLPPNTTSKSRPMDQGIIQAVKLKYRRRQLQHILANMTRHKLMSGSELLKQISVLDAIYWVNRAWDQVETDTIVKCFAAAGFVKPVPVPMQPGLPDADDEDDEEDSEEDDVPLQVIRLSMDLFGVGFTELAEIDRKVTTCDTETRDWDTNAREILRELHASDDNEEEEDVQEEYIQESMPTTTLSDVHAMADKLRDYALQTGNVGALTAIVNYQECVQKDAISKPKQSTLDDFVTIQERLN